MNLVLISFMPAAHEWIARQKNVQKKICDLKFLFSFFVLRLLDNKLSFDLV